MWNFVIILQLPGLLGKHEDLASDDHMPWPDMYTSSACGTYNYVLQVVSGS